MSGHGGVVGPEVLVRRDSSAAKQYKYILGDLECYAITHGLSIRGAGAAVPTESVVATEEASPEEEEEASSSVGRMAVTGSCWIGRVLKLNKCGISHQKKKK
eukprot:214944_1